MVSAVALSTTLLLSVGSHEASAQVSVSGICVLNAGATCTLMRFLLASGIDPVSLVSFQADFAPGSGWLFAGGPTGSFTAEDDFSFGVPYGGSTSIANGGLSLIIAFISPPTFELAPFSSGGYIEVATAGQGNTAFQYSAQDPDGLIISNQATLTGPNAPPVTATPEPATMMLVASGLAGVAGIKRRWGRPS
jgi:hypothetical protein